MQPGKGLPFEWWRRALISNGYLSWAIVTWCHLPKLTSEDFLTDGGLASAGDFLIGKHHCPILPISCSFIEGTHTASLSLWCSIPVVYSTPGRNPLCNSLTHKWLLWKWLECHTQRIITFGWVPSRLYKLWKTLFQTSWKTLSQTFQKVAREKIDFWKHKCVDKSKILQSSIIGHLWSF